MNLFQKNNPATTKPKNPHWNGKNLAMSFILTSSSYQYSCEIKRFFLNVVEIFFSRFFYMFFFLSENINFPTENLDCDVHIPIFLDLFLTCDPIVI